MSRCRRDGSEIPASRLWRLLGSFVEKHNLGVVGPKGGFILSRNPDTVRAPDLAFVSAQRMGDLRDRGYFELAPDLAIETLSPDDRPGETYRKIGEYFGAGTRLVWIIDPRAEQVVAHHPDGRSRVYSARKKCPARMSCLGIPLRRRSFFRSHEGAIEAPVSVSAGCHFAGRALRVWR